MATQDAFTTEKWTTAIRFAPRSLTNRRSTDEVLCKHNIAKEYS